MLHRHMNAKLSLELLSFFTTLVDTGNLSETAARLSISPAKASRMVNDCRLCFGEQLFVRHSGGLAPTRGARCLAEKIRPIIHALESLSTSEVFSPATSEATIRIAVLDNALEMLFPSVLNAFCREAPRSAIEFLEYAPESVKALRENTIDFAVFPVQQLPDDLEAQQLVETPYVRVVRANHPLVEFAGKSELGSELARYRAIKLIVDPDVEPADPFVPGPTRPIDRTQTAIVTRSWLGAANMLVHTDCHTILPWLTVWQLAQTMPLAVLEVMSNEPIVTPSIVWHKRHSASPLHVWFRSICLSAIRSHVADVEKNVPLGPIR